MAAAETLRRAALVAGGTLVLRLSRTDEEAQRLGWPCAGAHLAMIRRIVEAAPVTVIPTFESDNNVESQGPR